MNNTGKNVKDTKEYYTIDLLHIVKSLWRRAWVIAIAAVLAASIGFIYSKFFIVPTYSSSIMLYVNNAASSDNNHFSVSSSQLSASQSLVETYKQILNNRTTMERIAKASNVFYSYEEFSDMITADSANGTEIMRVTVESTDPYEAAKIANCVAEVLPQRIAEVINGATMEVVDSAIVNLQKVSPSIFKYTAIGIFLGTLLSALVLVILAIKDDVIHESDYVMQTYNYPILAKIPDLLEQDSQKRYAYGYGGERK